MSDNKGKSFAELLNGQELDLDLLDLDETTKKFEDYFESEEFQNDYKNWMEENKK